MGLYTVPGFILLQESIPVSFLFTKLGDNELERCRPGAFRMPLLQPLKRCDLIGDIEEKVMFVPGDRPRTACLIATHTGCL